MKGAPHLARSSEILPSEDEEAAMSSQRHRGSTVAVIRETSQVASSGAASPMRPRLAQKTMASPKSSPAEANIDELEKLKSVAFQNRRVSRLWQVLLLDVRLMYCIAKSAGQDGPQMTSLFLRVTDAMGSALPFCRKMILFEFLEHVRDHASIMRGNSVATRLGTAIGRKRGGIVWLSLVLRDVVGRCLAPNVTLDLDGSVERSEAVQRLATMLLERIETHLDCLPSEVRAICGFILNATLQYTPDLGYRLVGGYLLLRLINPVVLDPLSIPGLLLPGEELSALGRRNLAVLANVVQHLSNETPFKKETERLMNPWLSAMAPTMERLLERVCQDPETPPGFGGWERYRVRKLGENGGKVAARVLTPEEADWATRVFFNSRTEVLAKLKRLDAIEVPPENPRISMLLKSTTLRLSRKDVSHRSSVAADLRLADVLFARVAEAMEEVERAAVPQAPEPMPTGIMTLLSKSRIIGGQRGVQLQWRQDMATNILRGHRVSDLGGPPEESIDLSQVFGVYSRIDQAHPEAGPTLLDVHTPSRTYIFSFRDQPSSMRHWLNGFSAWASYLRPDARRQMERKPLQGYLKKRGNRGPAVLRQFRSRWFHQINDRLYYFEDVLSNSLGYIDLASLQWVDFPAEPTDGKWLFRLRQRRHVGEPVQAVTDAGVTHSVHSLLAEAGPLQAAVERDSFANDEDYGKEVGGGDGGGGGDDDDDDDDDEDDDDNDDGDGDNGDDNDDGKTDQRLWVLVANTKDEFDYWREGLSQYCTRTPSAAQRKKSDPRPVRQSLGASFAEASLSSARLEELQSKRLAEYTQSPPPIASALLDWLLGWVRDGGDTSVPFSLGARKARKDSEVANLIADLCEGATIAQGTAPRIVGGALLYALGSFPVPVVPEHQLAHLCNAQAIPDPAGRGAGVHAVLCTLPWQHADVLHACVAFLSEASDKDGSREKLAEGLAPALCGVEEGVGAMDAAYTLLGLCPWSFVHTSAQYGRWERHPTSGTLKLEAAPLPSLMGLLSHPFTAEADPEGSRAFVALHTLVAPTASILSALGELFTSYGGGPKRPSGWRAQLSARSGKWPEQRAGAVLASLRQWCMIADQWGDGRATLAAPLVQWTRDRVFQGVSYHLIRDEVLVDMSTLPSDAYACEKEWLAFLAAWRPPALPRAAHSTHVDEESLCDADALASSPPDPTPPQPQPQLRSQPASVGRRGGLRVERPSPANWHTPTTMLARSPRMLSDAPPLEEDEGGSEAVGHIRLGAARKSPQLARHPQRPPEDESLWLLAPQALAAALAARDGQLLRALHCSELLLNRWRSPSTAPTWSALKSREQWYRDWSLSWVMRYTAADDQAVAMVLLTKLAIQLRCVRCYLGSRAIVAALTLPPLQALRRTISLVPQDYKARLDQLMRFYESPLYETELEMRSLPVIPVPSDVEKKLEAAEKLSTFEPAPGDSQRREWVSIHKLRVLWTVLSSVGRQQKAALASAFEVDTGAAEEVRRMQPPTMDEAQALHTAVQLEKVTSNNKK